MKGFDEKIEKIQHWIWFWQDAIESEHSIHPCHVGRKHTQTPRSMCFFASLCVEETLTQYYVSSLSLHFVGSALASITHSLLIHCANVQNLTLTNNLCKFMQEALYFLYICNLQRKFSESDGCDGKCLLFFQEHGRWGTVFVWCSCNDFKIQFVRQVMFFSDCKQVAIASPVESCDWSVGSMAPRSWSYLCLSLQCNCFHSQQSRTSFFPEMLLGLKVGNWQYGKSIPFPIHTWPHAGNVPEYFRDIL